MNNDILKHTYLTVSDIGTYLNISQSKAYALVRRKDFPSCRFDGTIRIPCQAFLEWVTQNTRMPTGAVTSNDGACMAKKKIDNSGFTLEAKEGGRQE